MCHILSITKKLKCLSALIFTFIYLEFAKLIVDVLPVSLLKSHRQQLRTAKWSATTTTTTLAIQHARIVPILSGQHCRTFARTQTIQVVVTVRGWRVASTDYRRVAPTERVKVAEAIAQLLQLVGVVYVVHDLVQLVFACAIVGLFVVTRRQRAAVQGVTAGLFDAFLVHVLVCEVKAVDQLGTHAAQVAVRLKGRVKNVTVFICLISLKQIKMRINCYIFCFNPLFHNVTRESHRLQ